MAITNIERQEILNRARTIVPDAEFAPQESWHEKDIIFEDSCGCYSEYTIDPCSLIIFLNGTLIGDGHEQRQLIERELDRWKDCLIWYGCDCCDDQLYLNLYLFAKK